MGDRSGRVLSSAAIVCLGFACAAEFALYADGDRGRGGWCKAGNVFAEDHGHGVRRLVTNPKLLAPIPE